MARTRTFLGIGIDKAVRQSAIKLQEELAQSAADVKWVEPVNLHLTLLFLGEVDDRELVDICRATSSAAAEIEKFSMALEGVGAFPNPRRPRNLWLGVGQGRESVLALHAVIEAPLLELGCYRREARPFSPHLTLGRVNSAAGEESVAPLLAKYALRSCGETTVSEVQIMTSKLKSSGPEYTVVGRARLG
jgi:RNA 2',3'-cyclic 3'-phosphodiesterase